MWTAPRSLINYKDVAAQGVRCGLLLLAAVCLLSPWGTVPLLSASIYEKALPIDLLAGLGPVPRAEPQGDHAGGFLGVFVV